MENNKNKNIDIESFFDNETDPMLWIDLMGFKIYQDGMLGNQHPVEWSRERMRQFLIGYDVRRECERNNRTALSILASLEKRGVDNLDEDDKKLKKKLIKMIK